MKFRKKPIVIEAVRWDGKWYGDAMRTLQRWSPDSGISPSGEATIDTLEGRMRASVGDWIIKGVKGEVYPCKPDIFEATYELAEHDPGCKCVLCLH